MNISMLYLMLSSSKTIGDFKSLQFECVFSVVLKIEDQLASPSVTGAVAMCCRLSVISSLK